MRVVAAWEKWRRRGRRIAQQRRQADDLSVSTGMRAPGRVRQPIHKVRGSAKNKKNSTAEFCQHVRPFSQMADKGINTLGNVYETLLKEKQYCVLMQHWDNKTLCIVKFVWEIFFWNSEQRPYFLWQKGEDLDRGKVEFLSTSVAE